MKNIIKVSKIPLFGLTAIIAAITLTLALAACAEEEEKENFTDKSAFVRWLIKQPENTPDDPYRVKLNIKDESLDFTLSYLSSNPATAHKYIYLDCSGSLFTKVASFSNCTNLIGIILPDSVTSIDTFSNCSNLTSVKLPTNAGYTTIERNTFFCCSNLTDITIPNSITSIEFSAFNGCTGLTELTIPNSVNSIGGSAFANCTGLTSIIIPSSVTVIEAGAFYGCDNITSVKFEGSIPKSNFVYATVFTESQSFPGDLYFKFYEKDSENGTPGTYTRSRGNDNWTLQS